MSKRVMRLFGVIGVLVGLAFVMPAVLRDTGAPPTMSIALSLLGLTLTISGGAAADGARRQRALRRSSSLVGTPAS